MAIKIAKYIFVFLAFVALLTVAVSQGCTAGAGQAAPQSGAPGATSNQQPGQSPDRQGGSSRNPDFMNNVMAKVATKLGVSADAVTQAYQQARATLVPPAPPSTPSTGGQAVTPPPPGQGRSGRPSGSDNRTAFMSAIFDKMSVSLNIPSDQISTAWQSAMTELRPSNSSSKPPRTVTYRMGFDSLPGENCLFTGQSYFLGRRPFRRLTRSGIT
jgi:hypothetical protein